jgi:hypothetical protein
MKEISIARYSAPMVHEAGRKNTKDKDLELAPRAIDWTADAIREFVSQDSLLFRAPGLMLELNLKRLDLFIAPAASVFSFPHIISGI